MTDVPFPQTKTCTGPAHDEPVALPLTPRYWHFVRSGRRTGLPLSRCKQCQNWAKLQHKDGPHGVIDVGNVRRHATELLERCGSYATVSRRYGINDTTLAPVVRGVSSRVQLRTAQRILTALTEQRRLDRLSGQTSERFRRAQAARARDALAIERQMGRTS